MIHLKQFLSCLALALSIPTFAQSAQPLNDSTISAAIQKGIHDKHQPGLHFIDKWAAMNAGLDKTGTVSAGFSVDIYTPTTWIEYQAFSAHHLMEPFTMADVTPDMRRDVLRVVANANTPTKVTAKGMSTADSVAHVVLRDAEKKIVVQPDTEAATDSTVQSAISSPITMHGRVEQFSMASLAKVRGSDGKGEFFVTVIGNSQKKDFKVKTKDFALM